MNQREPQYGILVEFYGDLVTVHLLPRNRFDRSQVIGLAVMVLVTVVVLFRSVGRQQAGFPDLHREVNGLRDVFGHRRSLKSRTRRISPCKDSMIRK